MMKRTVVIGAGPAGLTAAYELLAQSDDMEVIVLEETDCLGGISKTVNYKGNCMDMGGHRFFSKDARVNEWWDRFLPMQGIADPDKTDEVMLKRHRISRILFDSKFYDYPVSLKPETIKNFGFFTTVMVGCSYLKTLFFSLPEDNLENFYINSFGKKLYSMFFEYYTENLWGRHPSQIDASWGKQRTKGLSIIGIIKDYFGKLFKVKNRKVNTSLIEEFKYPKYGPGQLWEITGRKIEEMGGRIIKKTSVSSVSVRNGKVVSIGCEGENGHIEMEADHVISSMPVKDLVEGLKSESTGWESMDSDVVPQDIRRIAAGLPYRDYMTLGVLVKELKIKNNTDIKTIGNIIPDCWIYIQDRSVKMGRIQIYNNWSPYMIKDVENTVWLGLEYFVNEGDEFWNMSEDDFSDFCIDELIKLGFIDSKNDVLDRHMEKVKKAYPAYFDTYSEMDKLIDYLSGIENLYCVGRNGQHRYNNMDHSMVTAFEAVKCIVTGNPDKSAVWNVNTEKEYHEEKKS